MVASFLHSRSLLGATLLCFAMFLPLAAASGSPDGVELERISVSYDGSDALGVNHHNAVSADGRYVAFQSNATDLVGGSGGNYPGLFLRDRKTDATEVLTATVDGAAPNWSTHPSVSGNGRYVAFESLASNLVKDDEDYASGSEDYDVFLRDTVDDVTLRVSRGKNGGAPRGESYEPAVSDDGTHVAFTSTAANLVADDDNGVEDAFVYNVTTGKTVLVSRDQTGRSFPETSRNPSISRSGRFVAFDSTNRAGRRHVYVYDRREGFARKITSSVDGEPVNGGSFLASMSGDGKIVAFATQATNLARASHGDTTEFLDVYAHNRRTKRTWRVSVPQGGGALDESANNPDVSQDGDVIVFDSLATNLIGSDPDAIRDIISYKRSTGKMRVASRTCAGKGDAWSLVPSVSHDGRYIAFDSEATNLDPPDENQERDVYVRDMSVACP